MQMNKKMQKGIALVIALVLLTSMTIVGVSSVSSGVMQTKMATNQNTLSMAFDAAEAAVEGIAFEGGSQNLRAGTVENDDGDTLIDVLTEARNSGQLSTDNRVDMTTLPTCDDISNVTWAERRVTSNGLQEDEIHNGTGALTQKPGVQAWSKAAFIGLKNLTDANSGMVSSIVDTDGARNRTIFEVFMIKGCGHVDGTVINVANTVVISRQTVELGEE
jgi:type IV pilus assembly protein PilX